MQDPSIIKILQKQGEINDELDYAIMNYLLQNRGPGYTACQPSLVELEDGKQAFIIYPLVEESGSVKAPPPRMMSRLSGME